MEALTVDAGRGEQGVGLFTDDRNHRADGVRAVFTLVGGVVANRRADVVGLIDHAAAHRAGIDFHEAHNVGILATNEGGDVFERLAVRSQIPGARERQVKRRARAGRVANVVNQYAHGSLVRDQS